MQLLSDRGFLRGDRGGTKMRRVRYYLTITESEKHIILKSLIQMKNKLIREGRFTDCVDELITKIATK